MSLNFSLRAGKHQHRVREEQACLEQGLCSSFISHFIFERTCQSHGQVTGCKSDVHTSASLRPFLKGVEYLNSRKMRVAFRNLFEDATLNCKTPLPHFFFFLPLRTSKEAQGGGEEQKNSLGERSIAGGRSSITRLRVIPSLKHG